MTKQITPHKYNVIYIGSGPATIFSVLSHPLPNSLIIEKGKPVEKRTNKDIIYGFGGAGTFSDSKLVCSGRITQLRPDIDFEKYAQMVLDYYNDFSNATLDWKTPDPYEIPSDKLHLIKSKVCHVGSDRGRLIFRRMQEYIENEICPIYFEEEVVTITPYVNGFIVQTDKSKYMTKKVVLATGTRDHILDDLAVKLDLKKKTNNIQIGVRVECPNTYMKDLVDKFYDFKIAMKTKDGYFRTFCVNSGAAYVAIEKDGNYVSANGHAYHHKPTTHLTNFGLLGQLSILLDKGQQIEMAQKINAGKGKVLAQNLKDFLAMKATKKQLNYTTTVDKNDYYLGNLWDVLDRNICEQLKDFIVELKKHYKLKGHLFAPEINLTNPIVETNRNLEIYPNLYVIGDIMITRSIVDAGVSGILLSETLKIK